MKKLLMTLIAISTVTCSCQQNAAGLKTQDQKTTIIGGEAVSQKSYARQATVGIYNRGSVSCTGVLISRNLVATAAHCVQWAQDIQVGFGEAILPSSELKAVADIIIHPEFKFIRMPIPWDPAKTHPTSQKDIAVLKLVQDAPEEFTPAVIYKDTDLLPLGSEMLLAGFGLTDDVQRTESKSMNEVQVSLYALIDDYLVFNQENNKGTCFGDSGGPAYVSQAGKWYVAGITHGARPGYEDCHHETDYTSLSKHTDFIINSAELLQVSAPVFAQP